MALMPHLIFQKRYVSKLSRYIAQCRGQTLANNSNGPPDFRFSNRHCPTQDLIGLDFQHSAVPLQSIPKTIIEYVSYLFSVLLHIGIIPKDN